MNSFRTEDLNGSLHWVCGYAGRRINSHLFIRYKQQFHLTDFFRTFVRNLNFNKFNWAEGWAERAMNASAAAALNVVCRAF
jgi:hypothetical protein